MYAKTFAIACDHMETALIAIVCDHMETRQMTISTFLLGYQVQPSINHDQLKQKQINVKQNRKNITYRG